MTVSDQTRRCYAGTDASPPSASGEAGPGQSGRPDRSVPATGEALVMPLEGGGEVRLTAVHGRVDMQIRVGKGRSWLTTPVSAHRAQQYAEHLLDIANVARAQREARNA